MRLLKVLLFCAFFIFANTELVEVNDGNLHDIVNTPPYKWFLVFHLPACPHCKKTLETLETLSKSTEDSDIKIGTINCDVNHMSCIGFEIKQVPFMIKVQDNKYIEYDSYPHPDNLKKFFDEHHNIEDMKELPERIGYTGMFLRVFKEAASMVSSYIRDILKQNNIDIPWEDQHSYFLMIGALVGIILLEIIILYCCCSPKKHATNINQEDNNKVGEKSSEKTEEKISENSPEKKERDSSKTKTKKKME